MRSGTTGWILLAAATVVTAVAMAASFDETPVVTDAGTTLVVRGTLTDLATAEAVVRVRATGTAQVRCINPAGNEAPGRNRTVRVTVNGETRIDDSQISNGATSFEVATQVPRLSSRAAGCASGQGPEVTDVRFNAITLRVIQKGSVVLRKTLTNP